MPWLFWPYRENGLIRKIRLFSNNNYNIHVAQYLTMSRSKGNHTTQFGQLINYIKRNNFLQKSCGKWSMRTSFRPLFVVKKTLYEVKASGVQLSFNNFVVLNLVQWKKTAWNFRLLIQRYAQFWVCRKESSISFSTTFCVWFFKRNVSHVIFY